MINAYQAKQATSMKSWTALTEKVEQEVMEAVHFGNYGCRFIVPTTDITELARLIIELAQDRYSVEVKTFINRSWQLYISWDNPNESLTSGASGKYYNAVKIHCDVDANSNRAEELKSTIMSLAPDAGFKPE